MMISKLVKLLNLVLCFSQIIRSSEGKVQNLSGRANFHSILLRWERHSPISSSSSTDFQGSNEPLEESSDPTTFVVKVCENQHWGTDNCREIVTNQDNLIKTEDDGVGGYEAYSFNLKGLRMATSYTISVVSMSENEIGGLETAPIHSTLARLGESRSQRQFDTSITKDTKGFSAKATACNTSATQIHLETGPHFGGRISLEGIDPNSLKPRIGGKRSNSSGHDNEDNKIKEDCSFYGDPKSIKPFVIFDIDHEKCQGVHVNGTSMRAYVVVQESLSILTHSTRKFMVVCNFKPSTFTIQTGLSMPAPGEISRIKDVLSFRSNRLPTTTTIKTPFQGPKRTPLTTTKTDKDEAKRHETTATTHLYSGSPTEKSTAMASSFTTESHIGKAGIGNSNKARIDFTHNATEATEGPNKSESDPFANILNQENWPEDENRTQETVAFPSLVSKEYTITTKRPPFYFQPHPQKLGPKELPRSVMNPVAISFSGSGADWSREKLSTLEDDSDKGQASDYGGEAMPRAFGMVRRRRKLITTPDNAQSPQTSTHTPDRDPVSSGELDDGSPAPKESGEGTPHWTSLRSGLSVPSKFLSFSPSHTVDNRHYKHNSQNNSGEDGDENGEIHGRSNEILDRYPPTYSNEERTSKSEEASEEAEATSSPKEIRDKSYENGDELLITGERQGVQESPSREFTDEWLPGGSNHFPIFLQDPSENQVDVFKTRDQSTSEIQDGSSLPPDDSITSKSSYDRDITFQKPDDRKMARQQKARKGFQQSSPSTSEQKSEAASPWFVVPDDYEQPITHIVLMIVLVISAIVGTIATSFWIWKSRSPNSKTGAAKAEETSDDPTPSVKTSVESNSTSGDPNGTNMMASNRTNHQSLTVPELVNDYEDIEKNPNDPKSLNPRVESFA